MFITHFRISTTPSDGEFDAVKELQLTEIAELGLQNDVELRRYVHVAALSRGLVVDWDSWVHESFSRTGCVNLRSTSEKGGSDVVVFSWTYNELDDLDKAEHLSVPVDHRDHALGSLTPEQVSMFWQQVAEDFEPFALFDDTVRRMGLIPRDHDDADEQVLRYVLALQWWRAFPTVEAGEKALSLEPSLTGPVVAHIMLMASLCFLEGQDYELAPVLIHV